MPNDPIYKTILLCLGLSVIAGAVLALVGDHYLDDEGTKNLGVGIVMIAGACYVFFRILGIRQLRRERRQRQEEGSQGAGEGEVGRKPEGKDD